MPRLFQINDEDLSALEKTLPELAESLAPTLDTRLRIKLRQVQKILSNVRWNYGPPSDVDSVQID